jgi:hypothetical protein
VQKGDAMTEQTILAFLAWSSVVNLVFLAFWFLFFVAAHDWMYRYHTKWFKLSVEKFDSIHYTGMAAYKIGIVLFNLVPYLVLRIFV